MKAWEISIHVACHCVFSCLLNHSSDILKACTFLFIHAMVAGVLSTPQAQVAAALQLTQMSAGI